MSFREFIENQQFNVVINFPSAVHPHITIYMYTVDPQNGAVAPHPVMEYPSIDDCIAASRFIARSSHFPRALIGTQPPNQSVVTIGLDNVRAMLTRWGQEYQAITGQEMFPSPEHLACSITQRTYEIIASLNDISSNGQEYFHEPKPEEEYRPGIYL